MPTKTTSLSFLPLFFSNHRSSTPRKYIAHNGYPPHVGVSQGTIHSEHVVPAFPTWTINLKSQHHGRKVMSQSHSNFLWNRCRKASELPMPRVQQIPSYLQRPWPEGHLLSIGSTASDTPRERTATKTKLLSQHLWHSHSKHIYDAHRI